MKITVAFIVAFLVVGISASAQTDGDYQSRQTGNWWTISTWQVFNGGWVNLESAGAGPWMNAVPQDTTEGFINIRSANVVTINQDLTTQNLTVDLGATLDLASTINLSFPIFFGSDVFTVNGTFSNHGNFNAPIVGIVQVNGTFNGFEGSTFIPFDAGFFFFNAGSNYFHRFQTTPGDIPLATWDTSSTMTINGYTTNTISPSGFSDQSYGNLIWNTTAFNTGATSLIFDLGLTGTDTEVKGHLTVSSTGANSRGLGLNNAGGTFSLTVHGNATFSGGITYIMPSAGTGSLIVEGNVTSAGGNIVVSNLAGGTGNFNIGGNFARTSGTGLISRIAGTSNLTFDGPLTSTFTTNSTTIITSGLLNIFVAGGSGLNLVGEAYIGGASSTATLNVGANAQIGLGSTATAGAYQNSTAAGNIRTATGVSRTISATSTFVYNGTGAQFIGTAHPSSVNTTINNSAGVTFGTGVTAVTIGGIFTQTQGNLSLGSGTSSLALNGIISQAGSTSVVVSANSTLIFGGSGAIGSFRTSGSTSILGLTLNRSGETLVSANALTVSGTFTQTAGDFDFSSTTLTLSGTYAWTAGTLLFNSSSTLNVTGATIAALPFGGGSIGTFTLNHANGATSSNSLSIAAGGHLNLTNGAFGGTGNITMGAGSTITRSAGSTTKTVTASTSYNVAYVGSANTPGNELPSTATALSNLTIATTVNLNKNITVNGILSLTSGSFNAGTSTIALKGNFNSSASSTLTSTTVTISGTSTLLNTSSVTPVFGNLTISGSGNFTPNHDYQINGNLVNNATFNVGTGNVTFGGTTAITGSATCSFNEVTINLGNSLTAPGIGSSMNVRGDFDNNGTFNHNNGTVNFNGTTTIDDGTNNFFTVSIASSSTLTAPTTVLGVAGNLTNSSGTFNHNGGTLSLNGTVTLQTITGAFPVNHVNVTNPSGVTNNGNLTLSGTFTLVSSGTFDADGTGSGILTVTSTAVNAGGRIAALPTPANFTGNVTVQRFIVGPQSYRYLSVPITNANVGMWQAVFPVTGNYSNPSPAGVNNVTASSAASVFTYNSTTQVYDNVGTGASTSATALANNVGYVAYTYTSSDVTASMRGPIGKGSVSSTIASSNFALVPNPYPSAIDWDNITTTGLSNTMSIRVANGVFASYTKGGPVVNEPFVGWTGEVATGQSFWVTSAGATAVNFTEAAKTSNAYQHLRERAPSNYIRLVLSGGGQRDETVVWFKDGATNDWDPEFDALKMKNGLVIPDQIEEGRYLNLSTSMNGGADMALNTVSPLRCNSVFSLKVTDVAPGPHELSFTELELTRLGYHVILVDRYLTKEIDVSSMPSYSFEVTADSLSYGAKRFAVRFITPGSVWIDSCSPPSFKTGDLCNSKSISVMIPTQLGVEYSFFVDGKQVGSVLSGTGQQEALTVEKASLPKGSNSFALDVRAADGFGCDHFVFDEVLTYDNQDIVNLEIRQDGFTLVANVDSDLVWFKDNNRIDEVPSSAYDLRESGTYRAMLTRGGCEIMSNSIAADLTAPDLVAFPNPFDRTLHLMLPRSAHNALQDVTILDAAGRQVAIFDSSALTGEIK